MPVAIRAANAAMMEAAAVPGKPMISARGFGVPATPWGAVQRAAWAAVDRGDRQP
jgi:hypothetical protein